jgi:transposase
MRQPGSSRSINGFEASHSGSNPEKDPVLMFKMMLLQFLYNLSDREMEEQAAFNLVYKWFLGLSIEELPPDSRAAPKLRR